MFSLITVDYNSIETTVKYIKDFNDSILNSKVNYIVVENGDKARTQYSISEQNWISISELRVDGNTVFVYMKDKLIIYVIYALENLGYGRGNNLGATISKALFDDIYYLFSNNDIDIEGKLDLSIIDTIFKINSDVGIIGPSIMDLEGRAQSPFKYSSAIDRLIFYYWKSVLKIENIHNVDFMSREGTCDFVSGSFVFVRKEAFESILGYDENIFLYGEEIILSTRMKLSGFRTYYTDKISVIHNHSQIVKSYFSVLNMLELYNTSTYYYYKTYEKTSKFILLLAKVNFLIFKGLYLMKHRFDRRDRKHEVKN